MAKTRQEALEEASREALNWANMAYLGNYDERGALRMIRERLLPLFVPEREAR